MAFQTQEVARIEAENKALEDLLKKANETIATVQEGPAGKAEGREAGDARQRSRAEGRRCRGRR